MRRIAPSIAFCVAALGLAWGIAAEPEREEPPRVGSSVDGAEVGGAGAEEGASRGLPGDTRRELPSPEAATGITSESRLAPAGLAPAAGATGEDPAPPSPDAAASRGFSPEDLEALAASLLRYAAPWEGRPESRQDLTLVGPTSTLRAGVTQRAYEVEQALFGLADDGEEVAGDPFSSLAVFAPKWTGDGPADRKRLVAEVYARTGEALWRIQGTGLAEAPIHIGGVGALPGWPLFVRQTAEGHRVVERVLDDLVPCGGDARTVRVWQGGLGVGALARGEVRRVEQPFPWSGAASSLPIEGPIELDVPATRAVTAFFGTAHAVLADYECEIGSSVVWMPAYGVAHEGRSVRARGIPETSELEVEFRQAHEGPPYLTFSCALELAGSASIEVPGVAPVGVVARVPALEGSMWLVGLDEGRAALVEVGASVPGAGPRRRGWGAPHDAWNPPSAPGEPLRAEAVPPGDRHVEPGWMRAGLTRPARAMEPASAPRTLDAVLRTGALEFARFGDVDGRPSHGVFESTLNGPRSGGSRPSQDPPCAGTRIQARWAGQTAQGAAYDVVLSVTDPVGTREAPPLLRDGAYLPLRLPSFRRAVVPLRIFVPQGGVGSRTVTLDLGRGPEPWTVTLQDG